MNRNKSRIYALITLICFVLFGLWYVYKKNYDDYIMLTSEPPEPIVNIVAAEDIPKLKVHVTGEVNNPGVYELESGARVEDAINAAGGFTGNAYDRSVNMAAKIFDEQQIIVYNKEEAVGTDSAMKSGKININKATAEELATLNGIGESTADNIVKYREQNGGFTSIDQLKNVSRIGDKLFESIKDDITVD